jgi:murein DD-endopeptidase MepM/ murein hydrolase activator NlpD
MYNTSSCGKNITGGVIMKNLYKKFLDFIDKKGFYLTLFVCIISIGATIIMVSEKNIKKSRMDNALQNHNNVQTEQKNILPTQKNSSASPKSAPKQQIVKSQTQSQRKKITVSKTKVRKQIKTKPRAKITSIGPLKLSYPVYGKIINNYSNNSLIFSKTLQEWTTHSGIDISSQKGEPVKAAADGTVKDVFEDPMNGTCITIEHRDGIVTTYSNLSSRTMVKIGQTVKRGTTISGIGSSANIESQEPSHLHFEVTKNGQQVDPKKYLPSLN